MTCSDLILRSRAQRGVSKDGGGHPGGRHPDCGRPQRRAEQARHACKSTTRGRVSGEASSKE